LLSAPLARFETPHHTPFGYHLDVQDVGHPLALGATGSGKSFLLNFLLNFLINFLITSAQRYDPFTIVLDLGHSYRKRAALLHGGQHRSDWSRRPSRPCRYARRERARNRIDRANAFAK